MTGLVQLTAMPAIKKQSKTNTAPRPLIIAVDFDGTLCKERWPNIGPPNQPLIDWLIFEKQKGVKLILWTMRDGESLDAAIAWCAERGLVFDAVNDNLQIMKDRFNNNPRKVFADVYIDNRNM